MTTPEESRTRRPTALEIATQWARLPPEHLRVALEHLELELRREHARESARERHQASLERERTASASVLEAARMREEHVTERARIAAQDRKDQRAHQLYAGGLAAGFVLAAGMLAGSVIVGLEGRQWLAGLLAGPSLIALPVVFVLRRSDRPTARPLPLPPPTFPERFPDDRSA
ncbi:hypothetical protein ACIQOV_39185 [Kitasatospora sp. NPDC091257]|uniref:hypothetical protein n=1 Tax=Kitasatospora sp. NPDC091257 TaxID=3364084 RepID=UPI00380EC6B4